jgi:hypothetical protein
VRATRSLLLLGSDVLEALIVVQTTRSLPLLGSDVLKKVNEMQFKIRTAFLFPAAIAALMLIANAVFAQDTTPKTRLRSPAAVRGFIGGESHDSYVIRVRKGRTMTVRISWRSEGENNASFTVSESADFFGAEQVSFGAVSADDKQWTGKIPRTRDYFIYVVAHPTAHFVLRVRVK